MNFQILTLFPEIFPGPLGASLPGKALKDGLWSLDALNIRDFAPGKHANVDDTPYAWGGRGMVMRADVNRRRHSRRGNKIPANRRARFTCLRVGRVMNQTLMKELAATGPMLLHLRPYEGVDERVIERSNWKR